MELQTISQISKAFNMSTRALRYYEQIGLITSEKKEDYAYRVYSEDTVKRLQQIIVLRKLRIPLKQIADILKSENTAEIIDTFRQNLSKVDEEIIALSTIRDIINNFINRLNESVRGEINLSLLDDTDLLEAVDSLAIQKAPFKEEKTGSDLQAASEKLNKLTDKDVRIVYLPPATVACIHCIGGTPESDTGNLLFDFIRNNNLSIIKPDFRHYGFNHPMGSLPDGSDHGFERWVTIPEDMEVSEPFIKKQFSGGLYGAHMIPIGAFDEWNLLHEWANNHDKFEIAWGNPECMYGLIEEHLNAMNHYLWTPEECDKNLQLDLLIPIKPKDKAALPIKEECSNC